MPIEPTTGARAITFALERNGVTTVFALGSSSHAPLLEALTQTGFAIISTRHETATVAAADGYARVTGRVGVALVKGVQGLPNAMGGICTAHSACSPVVVVVSLTPDSGVESRSEPAQEPLSMVRPYVKWTRIVPAPHRLAEFVDEAVRQALSGRPGVAVLGIRADFESTGIDQAAIHHRPLTRILPPTPAATTIQHAAGLIAAARRPLILAGSGAALSGAGPALRRLTESYQLPVMANALGRGLVPEDMQIGFPWPLAQTAAREADLVLLLGIRLTQRLGFGLSPRFNPRAKFIQVDIDPQEIGRNRHIDLPCCGDAKMAVEMLTTALSELPPHRKADPGWINRALTKRLARIESLGHNNIPPIHPYRLARDLMQRLPANRIYVGDGADIQNWMQAIMRIRSERSFIDHYPFGSMGVGLPLALGAAVGERELAQNFGRAERPLVLVTGDGSFGFYCSELNSARLAGLKLVCVISNDGAWGTERHAQIQAHGRSYNTKLGHCDYHLIATAYDCYGERIERPADFAPALECALAADRPTVLNVITDPQAGALRKTDPLLQTVMFDNLSDCLKRHYARDQT